MLFKQSILLTTFILFTSFLYSQNTQVILNSVVITLPGPGNWKQIAKNEESGQWMFENKKTKNGILLSAREKTKFEFYRDSLTDFKLVTTFYKWDADYWASDKKNEASLLKTDSVKKYIVWRLKTPQGTNLSLNGIKSDHLIGLQIQDNNELEEKEKIEFLESIYLK
jgi:hypothetical protein